MATIHSFELLRDQKIPELNTRARWLRHIKTGAELLSLENDDENKAFGISFRTPPVDSTGVAHILEHSVLCGSRKYPLKDPFVELIKGSLHTFLNAFTFPDKTCYPVASQNLHDFYNLVDVYLDTVFYPRLAPHTFEQQGWHYELEQETDPLIYKGVVFNEMKGARSAPDRAIYDYAQRTLFPDTPYGVDSGGNPKYIPDLTYEQLKAFHRRYYHPSNSRILFYGDDDPEQRLRILDAWLQDFERIPLDSAIPLQPRFDEPQKVVHTYAAGEDSELSHKGVRIVSWLLDEQTDPQTVLALHILNYILVGTPASPLRKALIDSGLGEDIAGGGLQDDLRQLYFSIGLKSIALENADAVEALIYRTLERLAAEGIDPATREAALNTVEFSLRENNSGSFPRGLMMMIRALVTWLHDGDPLAPLAFAGPLEAVKAAARSGAYFEGLIRRCFLENAHHVTLTLQPDPDLNRREEEEERARLDRERAAMSADELQAVVEATRRLKALEEMSDPPEALASLPRLGLADLERQNKTIPIEVSALGETPVLFHDLFTNGILYLDIGLDLRLLPQDLLPYVSLFGRALLQTGAGQEDFVRLTQRIGSKTGGIRTQAFTSVRRGTKETVSRLFLRAKAIPEQSEELLAILRDVLLSARLDNRERLQQMALEEKAHMEANLASGGTGYVASRLAAHFNEAGWVSEQMGGVTYLLFLRDLIQQIETDWPAVQEKLERMRQLLINRNALLCNVTANGEIWERVAPHLRAFLSELPAAPARPVAWSVNVPPENEGLTIPAKVNYVGKAADLYAAGYVPSGAAAVVTKFLSTSWLWERVRVQGGAYGGSCRFDRLSGIFTFLSYRDPNLLATLDIYDESARFLKEADLTDEERTRSIIGTIGDIDQYQLPDAKGFTSMARHLIGDTDEIRQKIREEVLSASAADFHAFAEALEGIRSNGLVAVMGSPAAIEAANAERGGWLKVSRVL